LSEDRSYGVFAHDASMDLFTAQGIDREALDKEHTAAIAFTSDGVLHVPVIGPDGVLADINATQEGQLPRDVAVSYLFSPAEGKKPAQIDVVVTVENFVTPTGLTVPGSRLGVIVVLFATTSTAIYFAQLSFSRRLSDIASLKNRAETSD